MSATNKKRKRGWIPENTKDRDPFQKPKPIDDPLDRKTTTTTTTRVSFPEFRQSTIREYSALTWLGPSAMAVLWFKDYLQKKPFGWLRLAKNGVVSPKNSKHNTQRKGMFYFIPGQYVLEFVSSKDRSNAIRRVLEVGTPGVHYATSYMGVYNLLRSHGRFCSTKAKSEDGPTKNQRSTPSVIPISYNGPPLGS